MRTLFLFIGLIGLAPLLHAEAGIGRIAESGLFERSLMVEFPLSPQSPTMAEFFFSRPLLGMDTVWIGGKSGTPGARALTAEELVQVKRAMRLSLFREAGYAKIKEWETQPPIPEATSRNYFLNRLRALVFTPNRPALTEETANAVMAVPTVLHAVSILGDSDFVLRPAPDGLNAALHIWADRLDEYRAVELRMFCDETGAIIRCLLCPYLTKNPPVTTDLMAQVRARGTYAFAEETFGPDSNYTALARNNGAMAFWETLVDGEPAQIVAVVDSEGRLERLVVADRPEIEN